MNNEYYEDNQKKYLENNFHYSRKDFIYKIEEIFLKLLPNCQILETAEKPILNINHRFGGPHPLHFEDIYYNYRMELLNNLITKNNQEEQIKEKYKKIYNEHIESIKLKKHQSEYDCRSSKRVD